MTVDKAYEYAFDVVGGKINAPKYVIKQCRIYLDIADGKDEKYCINEKKKKQIEELTKLLIVPRGLCANKTVYEVLGGFQWLFIFAVLTVVYRNDTEKRRYETGILEICRKNGKTFLIAVVFIILFFTEPKFSKFYSVAPDGSLSREIQTQIKEIIASSPTLTDKFKVRRDDILCYLNDNDYIPLAFSTSRLDGKLPNAFVADEVGALTSNYPIEAMRSGQLNIKNKLGCIISTKYPTINNPFEDEVEKAKQVLDGIVQDDSLFALLYEPDNTKDWESDDSIIEQSNPLALNIPDIYDTIKKMRTDAVLMPSKRENFVTKHCNIIYQGVGTETYIDPQELIKCRVSNIDWTGRTVYLGVDLSQTTDNTAVAMVALDDDRTTVLADVMAFIPEGRIEVKSREEKLDYNQFIQSGECIACGDRIIDYPVVEEYVFQLEKKYGCNIAYIGFDRANAMSSAQKWDKVYTTIEIRQHSTVLHPATKLLKEKILSGEFAYKRNKLLEINFQNAMVRFSENMNMYVTKKHSRGKVDMVVALINAMHLLNEYEFIGDTYSWIVQN
ncbi:MAG: terminase large subunit [Clostridia bacterium]|nr:terminase large subunit [Clostridia bacterium]